MAFVYKPVVVRKAKDGRKRRRRARFYWASYVGADGEERREALTLPNGEGITDKEVAQAELRRLVNRLEREAVGLIDHEIENAGRPIRSVVASYIQHLRSLRRSRLHVRKSLNRLKSLVKFGSIERLSDFTSANVSKALGVLADRGRSPRTIGHYKAVASAFGTYLVKVAKLLKANPVVDLPSVDTNGDVRKQRRALTPEQASRLLAAAGPRALWYETAMLTGLRVGEMKALHWGDVHVDGERPVILLRASTTKAKRGDSIPLQPALADKLRNAKPPFAGSSDRVFKTTPTRLSFRTDCARAGIDVKADAQGRTLDRHCLRVTFITWLSQAGVHPRVAQQLARHTDLRLTMQVYTDPHVLDLFGAVASLPTPTDSAPTNEANILRATGTYDEGKSHPKSVVPGVVLKSGERRRTALNLTKSDDENAVDATDTIHCGATCCATMPGDADPVSKRVNEGTRTPALLDHNQAL